MKRYEKRDNFIFIKLLFFIALRVYENIEIIILILMDIYVYFYVYVFDRRNNIY